MNPLRDVLLWASQNPRLRKMVSRGGLFSRMARRFVAGEDEEEALAVVRRLNEQGFAVTLDFLGENTTNMDEARQAQKAYLRLLDFIAENRLNANISVKLTQLGLDLGTDVALQHLMTIAEHAHRHNNEVEVDMEASPYVEDTLAIYETVQKRFHNAGIALQAYLYRTPSDIQRLLPLAPKIRLVKGAYKEPPEIAHTRRKAIQQAFRDLLDQLLRPEVTEGGTRVAIATHDETLIQHARERIRKAGIPQHAYEFQFLYGVRRELHHRLLREGQPVRLYVPFGTHWYPYLMRRLAERPANLALILTALIRG